MNKWKRTEGSSGGGALYFVGMVGAAIYFLQHAVTFGEGMLGLIKALVWPGILVYRVLELLKV
jgi:hypothetical protein